MLGYYNYTVIATYISVISAVCGVCFSLSGQPRMAVYCLLLSGLLDMFDGPIARTKKRGDSEKRFGIQIDSFSDFLAFGVLPAVIMFSEWETSRTGVCGWHGIVVIAASSLFVLAALIRLSYFNVAEEERQQKSGGKRTEFQGMPVTTIALILPAVYMVDFLLGEWTPHVLSVVLLISAALYISKIRFRKPVKTGLVIMSLLGILEVLFLFFGERVVNRLFAS